MRAAGGNGDQSPEMGRRESITGDAETGVRLPLLLLI